MADKEETCMAVTVYNLAQGKGVIIGDTVAVPEPFLTNVHFKYKQKVRTDCILHVFKCVAVLVTVCLTLGRWNLTCILFEDLFVLQSKYTHSPLQKSINSVQGNNLTVLLESYKIHK
jgi:hypothetical protein